MWTLRVTSHTIDADVWCLGYICQQNLELAQAATQAFMVLVNGVKTGQEGVIVWTTQNN